MAYRKNKRVTVHDIDFDLFISSTRIKEIIDHLSVQVNTDYHDKNPLFIIMLNGAFIFASDLLREIIVPSDITMARTKSYEGLNSTGNVKLLLEPDIDLKGRNILIIEDILDTGNTLNFFINYLNKQHPESIEIISLLSKPIAHQYSIPIKYLGINIPDKFVIGYGLDFNGQGRNLPHIYQKI